MGGLPGVHPAEVGTGIAGDGATVDGDLQEVRRNH
jgi:hypothetical protein